MYTIEEFPFKNNKNIFYKYFTINTNFYNSIIFNYLWFSDPANFNDPYDCNLFFDDEYNENDIIEYFKRMLAFRNRNGVKIESNNITSRINDVKKNPDKFKLEFINHANNIIKENYGICCFCKDFDNLLMWSHYGDKHSGICLGFDHSLDSEFFKLIYYVDYPPSYPNVSYIKEAYTTNLLMAQMTQFNLATKSKDWQYENEVRIVREKEVYKDKFRGSVNFKKESLINVIFGYLTDINEVNKICELFTRLGYTKNFYKMSLKKNEFGLNIEKVNIE